MNNSPARRPRVGFTLVELLVVIAIIAVLVALMMPAVQAAREAARRIQCTNNLRQVGLAMLTYHGARNHFPPGYAATAVYTDGASDTTPGWGWGAHVLPFMEADNLYKTINLKLPIENAKNAAALATRIDAYLCPSDLVPDEGTFAVANSGGTALAQAAPACYAACCGGDESSTTNATGLGVFFRNSHTKIGEISDGTSKTILVGEHAWSNANGIWAGAISGAVCQRGQQNPCPPGASSSAAPTLVLAHSHLNNATADTDGGLDDFSSRHPEGSNFVLADGSVHFIQSVASDDATGFSQLSIVFQALGTKAGGEQIPDGWTNNY